MLCRDNATPTLPQNDNYVDFHFCDVPWLNIDIPSFWAQVVLGGGCCVVS